MKCMVEGKAWSGKWRQWNLIFLFLLTGIVLQAQQAVRTLLPDELIPIDPDVKHGILQNGFSYYIQHNENPKDRVVMKLIVKVGNENEREDQLEFSHFIEHMAFRRTSRIQDVKSYLGSKGVRWGTDLGGSTGTKQTTYWVNITSKDDLVENSIKLIRDWAQGGIVLDPGKIDSERGVILEEHRTSQYFLAEMRKQFVKEIMGESKCSDMEFLFLNDPRENIRKFKYESLSKFYQEWYRPDLESIVIIGDIDALKTEQRIRSLFSDLKKPRKSPEKIKCPLENPQHNDFTVVTHEKMLETEVRVYSRLPYITLKTPNDFRLFICRELFNRMMSGRFINSNVESGVSNQSNVQIQRQFSGYGPPFSVLETLVKVNTLGMEFEFIRVMSELKRLKIYGFIEQELEKAKANILKSIQHDVKTHTSNELAEKYANHFSDGTAAPRAQLKSDLMKYLINEIKLSEVNAVANKWIDNGNRDVVILAPETDKDKLPYKELVWSWFEKVKRMDLQPYKVIENEKLAALTTPLIANDQIDSLSNLDARVEQANIFGNGITEFLLSNNVRVLVKPLTPEKDTPEDKLGKVFIKGTKPGGLENYVKNDYTSAYACASVISQSGLGPYDGTELKFYQKHKQFSVNTSFNHKGVWINGNSMPSGIEDMFQAVHLFFVSPKKDSTALKRFIADKKKEFDQEKSEASPFGIYNRILEKSSSIDSYDDDSLSLDQLEMVDPARMYEIYKGEFSDASDFTFVIVGDFKAEALLPLIIKYLGTLPSNASAKKSTSEPRKYFPPKITNKIIYSGADGNSAKVSMKFQDNFDYTIENRIKIDVVGQILYALVLNRLRNLEGLTYSPYASSQYVSDFGGLFTFSIDFSCTVNNIVKAIAAMTEEIESLRQLGPAPMVLENAKSLVVSHYENTIHDPRFWSRYLIDQVLLQADFNEITKVYDILKTITADDIRKISNDCLNESNYMQFIFQSGNEPDELDLR